MRKSLRFISILLTICMVFSNLTMVNADDSTILNQSSIPSENIANDTALQETETQNQEKNPEANIKDSSASEDSTVSSESSETTSDNNKTPASVSSESEESTSSKNGDVSSAGDSKSSTTSTTSSSDDSQLSVTSNSSVADSVSESSSSSTASMSKSVQETLLGAGAPADVSSAFHATVTTSDGGSEYVSGSTVTFLIKYKLDYGVINEGDYIYLTIPSSLSVGRLSVDPTHFSSASLDHTDSNGNQVYKLVFTAAANEGISGSMTLRVTANNAGTDTITPVVEIGDDSTSISVIPGGTTPSGQESRAIEKDALGSDSTGMSTGWNPTEAGYSIYDPDKGAVAQYRIFVNLKNTSMSSAVITDYLPAGLTFQEPIEYEHWYSDDTVAPLSESETSQINFQQDGNKLTWDLGALLTNGGEIVIMYKAVIPAGVALTYHNVAVIN